MGHLSAQSTISRFVNAKIFNATILNRMTQSAIMNHQQIVNRQSSIVSGTQTLFTAAA
jgi:hypothetical protein